MAVDITAYLKLVTSEHNKKPNFLAFITAIAQASVDQQNQLNALPALFDVDTAVGQQEDMIGEWVGVSRNLKQVITGASVLNDAQYRVLLKLFIAMNAWDGTMPGIYTIWNTVFNGAGFGIVVQDNQDMTMLVLFLQPPVDPVILAILTQGYFLLRPAGVQINGFFEPSVPGIPVFGFDAENGVVSGWDVGAWMIPIP